MLDVTINAMSYDMNLFLILGMYHCGMGPTHVNSFLASMEIPGMSPTNMKKREREVTQKIHSIARTSCDEALVAETKASQPLNRYNTTCCVCVNNKTLRWIPPSPSL